MKKISILTSTFLVIGFGLFALYSESKAQRKIDGAHNPVKSKYITSNGRVIVYLFPRDLIGHISNRKDTADYRFGDNLIQEFKQKIFLNKSYYGFAHIGDTVIFDNGFIEIRRPYFCEFRSPNGKGIIYVTPKNLPVVNYGVNRDTDWMFAGNHQIREYENKIFLNGKYFGTANAGDSVIFKKGSFFSKSTLSIKKGF